MPLAVGKANETAPRRCVITLVSRAIFCRHIEAAVAVRCYGMNRSAEAIRLSLNQRLPGCTIPRGCKIGLLAARFGKGATDIELAITDGKGVDRAIYPVFGTVAY